MTAIASHFVDTSPQEEQSGIHAKPVARPSMLASQLIPGRTAVRILDAAAARFGVTWEEMLSSCREAHLVNARHVAAWLMRQTGMSYPAIGKALGGRDHTTAMHAVAKVERERLVPAVASALDEMLAQLAENGATSGPRSSSGSKEGRGQL